MVLTALQEEHQAVLALLVDPETWVHPAGTRFDVAALPGGWRVALASVGEGNQAAAVLTERSIAMFEPVAVLFVGIAGGLHADIGLGDVVVAKRVYAFHGGRDDPAGFHPRPRSWEAPHELLQLAQEVARGRSWVALLPQVSQASPPTVHFAAIAAGEVVLNSRASAVAEYIRDHYNDAAAIETESAGFAQAGHLNRATPALTIRAISDTADGTKDVADRSGWRLRAARHAAAFAVALSTRLAADTDVGRNAEAKAGRKTPEVFISHISADRAWANWLSDELASAGYRVQIQAWRFQAEVDLVRRAYESLAEHECVVVLVSHAYAASPYSASEWTRALFEAGSGTRLVVRISSCELPPSLEGRIDVDIGELDAAAARSAVLDGLIAHGIHGNPEARSYGQMDPRRRRFPGLGPEVTNIPPRNLAFTGRLLALEEIHRYFLNSRVGVTGRVVYGLGGVGKSQLALEYTHRYASNYDVTWWVNAHSEATLVPDLMSLARALGARETGDQMQILSGLWRVLLRDSYHYLLIFDNADSAFELRPYWPPGGSGHVLVTSRNRLWHTLGSETQQLPLLGREESMTFLCLRCKSRDESVAAKIADRLGYLPLALEQAAAYVDGTGTTLEQYDELLRHQPQGLIYRTRSDAYEQTLAATWSISIQQAERSGPGSGSLLKLYAFLAPDDIPRSLVSQFFAPIVQPLQDMASDHITYDLAIGALIEYSLVESAGEHLGVHRLVQATVRHSLGPVEEAAWAETALSIMDRAFPANVADIDVREDCSALLPHVLEVIGHAERLDINTPAVDGLLRRGGVYLHGSGELTRARRLLDQALAVRERRYGADSAEAADSLMDLARLAYHSSDNAELTHGREQAIRALRLHEDLLGTGHPTVAEDLTRLGSIMRALGDLREAEELTKRGLAIRSHVLGEDHALVGESHHYLGYVYLTKGSIALARHHLERALAIHLAAVGPAHGKTGETLKLLGAVQRTAHEFVAARATLEHAVAILSATDGCDGVDTVAAENELADVYRGLGMRAEARTMFEHVLAVRQARHGSHPYVAGTLVRFSGLLRDEGNFEQAEEALRLGVQLYRDSWGPESPFVADALARLGAVLQGSGELHEANEILERAVRLCERNCGDHPFLADAMRSLASVRRDLGDLVTARSLEQRADEVCLRCGVGPDFAGLSREA